MACIVLALTAEPVISYEYDYSYGEYGGSSVEQRKKVNPAGALGIIQFLLAFAMIASLPYFILGKYSGKFWSTQAQLLGIEGHADLDWLEVQLFGLSMGRLKWATAGSTQSRHKQKSYGEYINHEFEALEPVDDELPTYPVRAGNNESKPLYQDRLFTLVDTYSMTAMVFRAVHLLPWR